MSNVALTGAMKAKPPCKMQLWCVNYEQLNPRNDSQASGAIIAFHL